MSTVTAPCHGWPTIREAAVELGVSRHHARNLVQSGTIRSVKLGDSHNAIRLVDPTSIVDYLARVHLPERRAARLNVKPELLEVIPAQQSTRGPVRGTRYPIRPLVLLLEFNHGGPLTANELADLFDTSRSVVQRARTEGLSETQADRWAVRIGYHPSLVWGSAWWEAYEAQQRAESMERHPGSGVSPVGNISSTVGAAA